MRDIMYELDDVVLRKSSTLNSREMPAKLS